MPASPDASPLRGSPERSPQLGVEVTNEDREHYTLVRVVCQGRPTLLLDLANHMRGNNLQVMEAQLFRATTNVVTVDLLVVEESSGAKLSPDKLQQLSTSVRDIVVVKRQAGKGSAGPGGLTIKIPGKVPGESGVAGHASRGGGDSNVTVSVSNDAHAEWTVATVECVNYAGLLSELCSWMQAQQVVLQQAHITTEGGRVVDHFYVTGKSPGGKVEDGCLEQMRASLAQAVTHSTRAPAAGPKGSGSERKVDPSLPRVPASDREALAETLRTLPMHSHVLADICVCEAVVDRMRVVEYEAGEVVVRAGDELSNFYVVAEGCCEVGHRSYESPKHSQSGSVRQRAHTFSDLQEDVLPGTPERSPQSQLLPSRNLVSRGGETGGTNRVSRLKQGSMLARHNSFQSIDTLNELISPTESKHSSGLRRNTSNIWDFGEGEKSPARSKLGSSFGTGHSMRGNNLALQALKLGESMLSPGETFGEIALMNSVVSPSTLRAVDRLVCYAVDRAHFQLAVEMAIEKERKAILKIVASVPEFATLSKNQRRLLTDVLWMRGATRPLTNATIVEGNSCRLGLVLEGTVYRRSEAYGTPPREIKAGSNFGSLLGESYEYVAGKGCTVLLIDRASFELVLGPIERVFGHSASPVVSPTSRSDQQASSPQSHSELDGLNMNSKQRESVPKQLVSSFTDVQLIRNIGAGLTAEVFLCKLKVNGEYAALKVVPKRRVIKTEEVAHVLKERRTLQTVAGGNFVVDCFGTFKDERAVYMVIDVAPCGDLFALLSQGGVPEVSVCRFMSANVLLALSYMHSFGFVYRDLKPENLLVMANGYLKLSDFGFAKRLTDHERAYTVCGTPDYIAPELLEHLGCTRMADVWGFGVFVYELLAGFAPFKGSTTMELYHNILTFRQVWFPRGFHPAAQDMVTQLLVKDETRRLGATGKTYGLDCVKKHPWFNQIDWEAMENMTCTAPYRPKPIPFTVDAKKPLQMPWLEDELSPEEQALFDDF